MIFTQFRSQLVSVFSEVEVGFAVVAGTSDTHRKIYEANERFSSAIVHLLPSPQMQLKEITIISFLRFLELKKVRLRIFDVKFNSFP